jgi:hypothetical protein
MCRFDPDPEAWEPVFIRRDRAEKAPSGPGPMRVRILCGAVDPSSPFIEGGCATDWTELLEAPDCRLECPGCGRGCSEEFVGCAREMLTTRIVFVIGCAHHAFTFSRRTAEPYFSTHEAPGGRRER